MLAQVTSVRAVVGCLFAVGCTPVFENAVSAQVIRGTVTYRERMLLPNAAVLYATLEDISRADAQASIVASTRATALSAPPIEFVIPYDQQRIVATGQYVVRVRISVAERLLFISDTATPVITRGYPTTVSMTLRQVGNTDPSATAPTTPPFQNAVQRIEGTAWTVVELYGTPVPAQPEARQPSLVFGASGRVSGADGCNRLTGMYTSRENGLSFGQVAGTQMACPGTEDLARRFRDALKGTSHWSVVNGRLELYGATGKPLAVLTPRDTAASSADESPLLGTSWQLVRFQGGDGRTLTPAGRSMYTIAFAVRGRLTARIDCNRGQGSWNATAAGQLELGPLALTRAKCPDGSLHDQMAKQWTSVRSFVLRDGHLFLSLLADGGTYEFEPLTAAHQ